MKDKTFGGGATMDTYCDSEKLKERILSWEPYPSGLYGHEMILLSVAAQGGATTQWMWREGELTYGCGVRYTQKLAQSLIDRGYLRLATDDEGLDRMPMKYLRQVLKELGEKPGSSKEAARSKLRSVTTPEEVTKRLGFRFLMPTEKGALALQVELPESENMRPRLNHSHDDELIKALDTKIAQSVGSSFVVRTIEEWPWIEVNDGENGAKYDFQRFDTPVTVVFRGKAGEQVSISDVVQIHYYRHERKMLVESATKDARRHSFKMVNCRSMEVLPYRRTGNPWELNNVFPKVPEGFPTNANTNWRDMCYYISKEKGCGPMYFSPCDAMADLLVNRFLAERGALEVIQSPAPDDTTKNYKLTIRKDDEDTCYYIYYLVRKKVLAEPSIYQTPLATVALWLYHQVDDPFEQVAINDNIAGRDSYDGLGYALQSLEQSISPSPDVIWEKLRTSFPREMFFTSPYKVYGPHTWREIEALDTKYEEMYKEQVLALKEEGLLAARWPSEFHLYLEVKDKYPDVRYQYRASWLGLQSIDMYIPSFRVGIEYQGKQHYEPVEYFGGAETFEEQQMRDERKARLCEKNGVRLVYWPYDEEITQRSVSRFLSKATKGLKKVPVA